MPTPGASGLFYGLEQLRTEMLVGFEGVVDTPFMQHVQEFRLEDNAGNIVRIPYMGSAGDFHEEFGTFMPDDGIGAYYLDVQPIAFWRGFAIKRDDMRDSRLPFYNQLAAADGAAAKRHRARRMINNVIEGSTLGFDGVACFSAAHTWIPTTQYEHKATYTTNQTNIVSGYGVATSDALAQAAAAVEAAHAALLNDRGNEFNDGDVKWTVIGPKKNAALTRLLRAAFLPINAVMPGEDTLRESNLRGYELALDPYLANNNTWYMVASQANRPKPLGLLARLEPEAATWVDERQPGGGAQIAKTRMRYEVIPYDWTGVWQIQA